MVSVAGLSSFLFFIFWQKEVVSRGRKNVFVSEYKTFRNFSREPGLFVVLDVPS